MRRPRLFAWLYLRMHCPHDNVVGIYGDEINHVGGWRKACVDCGALLHGGPPEGERPAMLGTSVDSTAVDDTSAAFGFRQPL